MCIIGAGPAGHLLGHLLRAEGSNARCSSGRRPTTCSGASARGLLEQFIVSLMKRLGLDARLKAEGLPHDGFNLADGERLIRVDVAALTGKHVMSMARPA